MGRKRTELQFKDAIDEVFREGADKHAIKQEGRMKNTSRVFSYAHKKNLLDFSDMLSQWLRENHNEVKYVKNITADMMNEFLVEKSKTVMASTIRAYASYIRKWEKIVRKKYKARINWSEGLVVPTKLTKEEKEIERSRQMLRKHYDQVVDASKDSRSVAKVAFDISGRFGARVEGAATICAKDVFLDNSGRWKLGRVFLKEKGGRERFVDIRTEDDRKYIEEQIRGKAPEDRLVPIKKDSINRQLNRVMTTLGLKEEYPDIGEHAIRKLYAQETWDMCRESGMGYKQTIRYMNRQLGHHSERDIRILEIYVKRMW